MIKAVKTKEELDIIIMIDKLLDCYMTNTKYILISELPKLLENKTINLDKTNYNIYIYTYNEKLEFIYNNSSFNCNFFYNQISVDYKNLYDWLLILLYDNELNNYLDLNYDILYACSILDKKYFSTYHAI